MNCPTCGEVCICSSELHSEETSIIDGHSVAESTTQSVPADLMSAEGEQLAWRNELSARLHRYRARRKAPPPRYPSLRLPFDGAGSATTTQAEGTVSAYPAISHTALALDGREILPAISEEALPQAPPVNRRAPATIIEFPRFDWGPPVLPPDQLAEPVGDQLRILEVPEIVPPPPALGGITIEPAKHEEAEKRCGVDIPMRCTPLGRRIAASLIDWLIIAAASCLFGFIFWKVTLVRPPRAQIIALAAGIPLFFWAAYQYLLIVYAATTPGLHLAGLALTRFDDRSTTRSLRRWRVLASYLSALSLGMGYAWIFLDEDSLCWHDRITHTCLVPRK
jgi:hypothetical protein